MGGPKLRTDIGRGRGGSEKPGTPVMHVLNIICFLDTLARDEHEQG